MNFDFVQRSRIQVTDAMGHCSLLVAPLVAWWTGDHSNKVDLGMRSRWSSVAGSYQAWLFLGCCVLPPSLSLSRRRGELIRLSMELSRCHVQVMVCFEWRHNYSVVGRQCDRGWIEAGERQIRDWQEVHFLLLVIAPPSSGSASESLTGLFKCYITITMKVRGEGRTSGKEKYRKLQTRQAVR